jgi:hypothetical protein
MEPRWFRFVKVMFAATRGEKLMRSTDLRILRLASAGALFLALGGCYYYAPYPYSAPVTYPAPYSTPYYYTPAPYYYRPYYYPAPYPYRPYSGGPNAGSNTSPPESRTDHRAVELDVVDGLS